MDKNRALFWSYVSAFGALWGTLELTLGTLLHTLHVPKTGFVMVSLSIVLLVAQRRVYPKRGSIVATGVVAAMIKSLSPGGIILGPVFGILTEALVMELILLPAPRNALLCGIGGGFTLLWSQIQGFAKQYIYYGKDIVEVYVALIKKFVSVESATFTVLIALIATIWGFGFVMGLWGVRFGNRVRRELDRRLNDAEQGLSGPCRDANNAERFNGRKNLIFDEKVAQHRRWVFLVALLTFVMQFTGNYLWSLLSVSVFIAALSVLSFSVVKALWWPKFWLATVFFAGLSGAILGIMVPKDPDLMLGFEAASRMLIRGIYIFALLQWFARCVRPEEWISIWKKIGLEDMGRSVTCAFEILPFWVEYVRELMANKPGSFRKNFVYFQHCLVAGLTEASLMAARLENDEKAKIHRKNNHP